MGKGRYSSVKNNTQKKMCGIKTSRSRSHSAVQCSRSCSRMTEMSRAEMQFIFWTEEKRCRFYLKNEYFVFNQVPLACLLIKQWQTTK